MGNIIKLLKYFIKWCKRDQVRINNVTINTVLDTYNKMNRPDKTIDTFELYQQYNIEPDIMLITV